MACAIFISAACFLVCIAIQFYVSIISPFIYLPINMSLVILINKAVEIEFSSIFCFECSDNVYDQDFEKLKKLETVQILSLVSHIKDPNCKRIKVNGWYPSSYDVDTIKKKSKMIPTNGLRGLRNLGSTCFLSVVLQCFLHNPLLQLHFLSDRHNSNLCPLKICMACEMDKMFASCYNGGKTPIAPTSFLYSIWLSQSHLAGYSEKDAHEFFISLLDAVHANCSGNVQVNCECIVHKVFAGLMQSTVTCHLCGNVTTTEDPILDISLDIKSTSGKIPEKTNLAECLEKYTVLI